MKPKIDHDILILGGGPAGLSAALTVGRMSRTALVCDDNRPRNAPSAHLNNFPTRDGIHPAEWRKEARRDLEKYQTIQFHEGTVQSVARTESGLFRASFPSGEVLEFRKVILADGIQDKLPDLPGFKELWGKAVFHCAYCHGFEVRGQALGTIANGEMAVHSVPLHHGLTDDLILFTHGSAELSQELREAMKRKNVELVETKISALVQDEGTLKGVALEDGRIIQRNALFVAPVMPFAVKSSIGKDLGCELTEIGLYKVTERNETTVKGVFAAGDNMTRMQSVLHACGHGSMAGAAAVFEVLNEALLT